MRFSGIQPARILLVEDDLGDAKLTQRAWSKSNLALDITWVRDGEAALDVLNNRSPYENAALPDLVLLDLNMPKMNGREVLAAIRADPRLTHLPVVVLTTSTAEQDVMKSYQLHANAYVSKPVDLEGFAAIVDSLEQFWFSIVVFPPKDSIDAGGGSD